MLKKNYYRLCEIVEKESRTKKGFREEVALKLSLRDEEGFEVEEGHSG